MRRVSIKAKLIGLIVIVLIPLIMLQFIRIKNNLNDKLDMELKASQEFAEGINLSFMNYLEEIWTGEYAMGLAIISNSSWDKSDVDKYMDNMLAKSDSIKEYFWVSPDGSIVSNTSVSMISQNVKGEDFFKRIINGEEKVIGDTEYSSIKGQTILPVGRAIRKDNKLVGIMVSLIDINKLQVILPVSRVGRTSKYGLIDRNGAIVYYNGNSKVPFEQMYISDNSTAWKALKGEIVVTDLHASAFDDNKRISIDYPITSIGWSCFVATSVGELLKDYESEKARDFGILFLVSVGSFIFAITLGNRFINSIKRLKEAAEAVTNGDLTVRTNFSGRDELAATSLAFDKMTEGINRLLAEAEEYSRLKTQFLSTVSHELKTPLNIILGAVQLIEKLDKDNVAAFYSSLDKYIRMLKQNSFRLLKLINNLIDINRIEGEHLTVKLSNNDIVSVIEDITLSVVEYTRLKNIDLIFDTEVEEKIMAFDPDKIERIILNLLSNAIKFTESGGRIEIFIYDKNNVILISVKDTGIGIPKDMQEKIFERFTQVDTTLRRRAEGSGIGLSLVKGLVEMHGGTIYVKSELNKGSEFLIELPVRLVNEDASASEAKNISNAEKIDIEFSDIYI